MEGVVKNYFKVAQKYYLTRGFTFGIIYFMENFMNIDIAYLIILIASIHLSFLYGKRMGIEVTIDFMEEQGHISFDDTPKNNS